MHLKKAAGTLSIDTMVSSSALHPLITAPAGQGHTDMLIAWCHEERRTLKMCTPEEGRGHAEHGHYGEQLRTAPQLGPSQQHLGQRGVQRELHHLAA